MKYLLIAFKSRNSIYSFLSYLKSINIKAEIINTPKNISSSCGLSLKINLNYYQNIINLVRNNLKLNIIGVFIIEKIGFQEKIDRIF